MYQMVENLTIFQQ